MALHGAAMLLNQGGYSGYQIDQSMVLDGSSDYLNWTAGTATDSNRWTYSAWIKRSELGRDQSIFGAGSSASDAGYLDLWFRSDDKLQMGGTATNWRRTSQVFRDVGAYGHLVVAVDTDQATAADRIKIYWNGVQITSFDLENNPGSGNNIGVNVAGSHRIGRQHDTISGANYYFNGYMSEINFVDGQQLEPTYFGEFYNGTTAWRPIQPSGLTYGTNGFYLPFTQDTPNLGTDYSGNGNDWTENGSPVQSSDSPTVNYATLNALTPGGSLGLSEGNLKTSRVLPNSHRLIKSTVPLTGKVYFECNPTLSNYTAFYLGFATASAQTVDTSGTLGDNDLTASGRYGYYGGLNQYNGTTAANISAPGSSSDYICWAIDVDEGDAWLGKHSGGAITWEGGGDPAAGKSPTFTFSETEELFACVAGNDAPVINFGATAWGTTIPTDFDGVYASRMPEATITDPGEYFNAVAYTGDGTAIGSGGNSITGIGFQSDFTWIKNRDATDSHMLFDVIRGATKVLHSNETAAETTESETLTSFDSDGFTLGSDVEVNTNTENYISWNWKAGGAGVVNTDGTISSTVSVNDDAGFSIVSYAGNSTSGATVGHGQSGVIELAIAKRLNAANTWYVQHSGLATASNQYLELNTTNAAQSNAGVWDGTEAGASVVTLGNNNATNGSGDDYIMYCFRSIPGYSKVFSYTGNGSTDGTFVYLGFKPRWVMVKRVDNISGWMIGDALRPEYNDKRYELRANDSSAEVTTISHFDILSNGFKKRYTDFNASGGTYIGIAFAENPFGGSNIPLGLAQ